jgi:hypothetical protein
MLPKKVVIVLNFSLALIAIILVINLLGYEIPTIGQALYAADYDDQLCFVEWQEDTTEWNDIDRCCLEARKQGNCYREKTGKTSWKCGYGNTINYLFNNKGYAYCQNSRIW